MGLIPFSRSRAAARRVEPAADDLAGLDAFLPENPAADGAPAPPAASTRRATRIAWVATLTTVTVVGGLAGVAVYQRMTPVAAAPPPVTASLQIDSDPSNATVQIDGTRRGVTPLTLTLPPGHHAVTVGDDTRLRMFAVDLAERTTTVHHVELPQPVAAGSLEVASAVPGIVTVDGTSRGPTPAVIAGLAPGDHQVVVTSQGTTYRRSVTVQAGARSSLVISNNAAASGGWLSVPAPVSLTILDHGHVVGTTESERIMLPAGDYDLELRSAALGFRASRRVTINAGRVSTVAVDLPQVPLQINAIPWAEVWIDGKRVGETPLANVPETIGPHEILFRHPQLGERRITITVTLDAPARATADMRVR